MRYLITFILLLCATSRAATGDITGAEIESNGWVLKVWVAGMQTNGTWNFGLGTNNSLTGNEKVVLNLTQPGFNDTGTSQSVASVIYGTKQLRLPYPNQTMADVTTNAGAGVIIRMALSEYVFAGYSSLSLTIKPGWYTDSLTSNLLASAITVTNSSTQTHPKCIANWSWPGWNRVTNDFLILRAVAFHRSANNGKPVSCVKFTATDDNTTQTVFVAIPSIDRTIPDRIPVQEYIANINCSGFSNNAILKCDFSAYPLIGDAGSVLNSSSGTDGTRHLFKTQTNVVFRSNTAVYAFVGNDGNNTTGVATNSYSLSAPRFLNIYAAIKAAIATNKALNSINCERGVYVYLTNGLYTWTGGDAHATETNGFTWLNISALPGCDQVWITNGYYQGLLNVNVHISGINFVNHDNYVMHEMKTAWLDRCLLGVKDATIQFHTTVENYLITHCVFSNNVNNLIPSLFRGNYYIAPEGGMLIVPYCVIGNQMGGAGITCQLIYPTTYSGITCPNADPWIYAFNAHYNITGTGSSRFGGANATGVGGAVVNNIMEVASNVGDIQNAGWMSGGGNPASTNVMFFNNTFLGGKVSSFYNDTGSSPVWMVLNAFKGNLVDDWNIKGDIFPSENGARIGNWSVLNGVSFRDNQFPETYNVGAPGSFILEFPGINTFQASSAATNSYFGFVDRQANWGVAGGTGGGNYKIKTESKIVNAGCGSYSRFDITGNARGAYDPPGAYNSASPSKGSAMGF